MKSDFLRERYAYMHIHICIWTCIYINVCTWIHVHNYIWNIPLFGAPTFHFGLHLFPVRNSQMSALYANLHSNSVANWHLKVLISGQINYSDHTIGNNSQESALQLALQPALQPLWTVHWVASWLLRSFTCPPDASLLLTIRCHSTGRHEPDLYIYTYM